MKKVFIGGSRRISRTNKIIENRVDAIIRRRLQVLVGDANGADKAIQAYLARRQYDQVLVFHSGSRYRNNLGKWETREVPVERGKRGFDFYAAKDTEMAREADYGFMLWDGESRGTLNNVVNLLERGKKVVVYFAPTRRCVTIDHLNHLKSLLGDNAAKAFAALGPRLIARPPAASPRAQLELM
jgi:hypothetical protein